MADQPPIATETLTRAVLGQYGAAMACVQSWEAQLAALVGAVGLKPQTGPPVPLEPTLNKIFRRAWHLLHRASASELRNSLRDQPGSESINEELLEEIGQLITWRDFLAHRYLRTRLYGTGEAQPSNEMVLELFRLGQAFSASSDHISLVVKENFERVGQPMGVPQEVRDTLAELTRALANAQPAPFAGIDTDATPQPKTPPKPSSASPSNGA